MIPLLLMCASLELSAAPIAEPPATGVWHAWLECPGGELPFGLELRRDRDAWSAWLLNGEERIPVPRTTWDGETLRVAITHFDSEITARCIGDVRMMTGTWRKVRGVDRIAEVPFRATWQHEAPDPPATNGLSDELPERWSVEFSSGGDPAVAVFTVRADGSARGTFMTTTGDYRFLAGTYRNRMLTLSCFDGGHAFLFRATHEADGTLRGDFWSGDWWHETWTARPDADVTLPDAFEQTTWTGDRAFDDLTFLDLDGTPRVMRDVLPAGQPRVVKIFGSWCPNCHDAAEYLTELDERYRARGLSVVGLAFELTGDTARDARQVRRFIDRHDIEFPVFLAGLADKTRATEQFGMLDRVRSFPTTIFIDREGSIRWIHTGFSGPATGAAYERLQREYVERIESLLGADGR